MADDPSAEAYAALVHIQAGHWDEYAFRLYAALVPRLRLRLAQDHAPQRFTTDDDGE